MSDCGKHVFVHIIGKQCTTWWIPVSVYRINLENVNTPRLRCKWTRQGLCRLNFYVWKFQRIWTHLKSFRQREHLHPAIFPFSSCSVQPRLHPRLRRSRSRPSRLFRKAAVNQNPEKLIEPRKAPARFQNWGLASVRQKRRQPSVNDHFAKRINIHSLWSKKSSARTISSPNVHQSNNPPNHGTGPVLCSRASQMSCMRSSSVHPRCLECTNGNGTRK